MGVSERFKATGFSLTDDHLRVIDGWTSTSGLNRSEAVRLAIETLADRTLIKDGFKFRLVKSSTGERNES